MLKLLHAFLLVLFVASCGIMTPGSAPKNLDNACSIVQQRPHYMRAFNATERKWGVPVNVQMAIIYQESKFKKAAKTPRKYFLGVIPSGPQSSDFMGWYMTETKRRTGVALSDARNQYLAYHEGQSGYIRGTYRKKPWLIEIANNVANRSETYSRQLKSCGKI